MLPRFDTDWMRAGASRRQWLTSVANGFGMLGLAGLLAEAQAASPADDATNPFAPKPPHHAPKAKRVIFLFMAGGPSHVDLFDPKPRLTADHGKPLPFEKPKLARTTTENLLASPFAFRQARRVGHRGERAAAAPGRMHRRPLRRPLGRGRQHQPFQRLPADAHGRAGLLAPVARLVAVLRAGEREPEPARLRGHRARAARTPGSGGRAFFRRPTRGRASPT